MRKESMGCSCISS